MEIISGKTKFYLEGGSAITIGKFDGIHVGHQMLLNKLIERKQYGEKTIVFTFDPPPSEYLSKKRGIEFLEKDILTREEKHRFFYESGVDVLIEFPMNDETAIIEAQDFVKTYLVDYLHVKYIVAGTDLSFGNKGEGNAALLFSMGQELHFITDIIEKVKYKSIDISSTYVKECLSRGEVTIMPELLGRFYHVSGIVQSGNQIGRTMGMPTVNLVFPENKMLPAFGVYYSNVFLDNTRYKGISNIGKKPTISNHEITGLETYLYDFDQNLYGKEITIELLKYKRPEILFSSKEELQKQMQKDISEGRIYHQI
jgi:riboflavin kinase / FMN adenylyltransferase